ncbi:MAG: hypothetical protein DCF16_10265 [Alphaproteobacteria bacterium]|nr:MAG: hypothetical protein DCF16_10265 [Alphaproteobacteria bacterium]
MRGNEISREIYDSIRAGAQIRLHGREGSLYLGLCTFRVGGVTKPDWRMAPSMRSLYSTLYWVIVATTVVSSAMFRDGAGIGSRAHKKRLEWPIEAGRVARRIK